MNEFLQPYNVIYWIPVALAFVWGLAIALGFISHGGHDGAADASGAGPHADSSGADHHDGSHGDGTSHGVMGFLGFGKAPTSFIVITLCMIWGLSGLLANQAIGTRLQEQPGTYFWFSLAVAIVVTVLLTRFVSLAVAKVFPTEETYTTSNKDLVGMIAQVDSQVNATSGSVMFHDKYGNLKQVPARAAAGQGPFGYGSRVKLIEYQEGANSFIVGPIEPAAPSKPATS